MSAHGNGIRIARGRQHRACSSRSGCGWPPSRPRSFLATRRLQPELMLTLLVVLSLVKAALIISYFMHLKYEKLGLALMLIPSTIFCICMIMIFFMPDGWRLLQMRLH